MLTIADGSNTPTCPAGRQVQGVLEHAGGCKLSQASSGQLAMLCLFVYLFIELYLSFILICMYYVFMNPS